VDLFPAGRTAAVTGVVAGVAARSVTGRFTRPDEVADLVVHRAGPRAADIAGAGFTLDGGLVQTA